MPLDGIENSDEAASSGREGDAEQASSKADAGFRQHTSAGAGPVVRPGLSTEARTVASGTRLVRGIRSGPIRRRFRALRGLHPKNLQSLRRALSPASKSRHPIQGTGLKVARCCHRRTPCSSRKSTHVETNGGVSFSSDLPPLPCPSLLAKQNAETTYEKNTRGNRRHHTHGDRHRLFGARTLRR
jgi:hypothetical protein